MNGSYELGDYVLTNWKLVKLLGNGAYGKVYEAEREEFGETYKSAIKIMTIPQSQSEVKSVLSEGMTQAEVTEYFQDVVKQIIGECKFMNQVKGVTNIVGYEDHVVIPHKGQMGWDVIIRMELLTPLLDYVMEHPLTPKDVARLGVDICRALEVCRKMNIVHRDVKPENIMMNSLGDYKLGDFGISRTMEKTQGGLSKKGTASYMAPEIMKGEAYGHTVDMYSLGVVMYRFLNGNRGPFLPAPPTPVTFSDREEAQEKRLRGDAMPMPSQADEALGRIVLKACAYYAKDRYASPTEMREELEAWLRGEKKAQNAARPITQAFTVAPSNLEAEDLAKKAAYNQLEQEKNRAEEEARAREEAKAKEELRAWSEARARAEAKIREEARAKEAAKTQQEESPTILQKAENQRAQEEMRDIEELRETWEVAEEELPKQAEMVSRPQTEQEAIREVLQREKEQIHVREQREKELQEARAKAAEERRIKAQIEERARAEQRVVEQNGQSGDQYFQAAPPIQDQSATPAQLTMGWHRIMMVLFLVSAGYNFYILANYCEESAIGSVACVLMLIYSLLCFFSLKGLKRIGYRRIWRYYAIGFICMCMMLSAGIALSEMGVYAFILCTTFVINISYYPKRKIMFVN